MIKMLLWAGGILLFFRAMTYLIAFLGGDIRDFWPLLAGASTAFIVFWGLLLLRWRLPGRPESEQLVLPSLSATANGTNAMVMTEETPPMPNKSHIHIDKMLNINHGVVNHNSPGGTMNFGPVTYQQTFETQQPQKEPTQEKQRDATADMVGDGETIDINGLLDFSAKIKSPGVSRTTMDKILRKANIKPCRTEKDGRTIRNLYPRKESQVAIVAYFSEKNA